ncbi:MAG: Panacea domain-containing protein [Patescibacteria group bacterium]
MKLFYFVDFIHFKRFGRPITDDRYFHLEHGPIPSTILNLVNSIFDEGEDAILADTIFIEKNEHIQRIKAYQNFDKKDENLFSKNELDVMKEVCDRFKDKDTKFIVKSAHNEAAWSKTRETEEIPYELAIDDSDCRISKEEYEVLKMIERA